VVVFMMIDNLISAFAPFLVFAVAFFIWLPIRLGLTVSANKHFNKSEILIISNFLAIKVEEDSLAEIKRKYASELLDFYSDRYADDKLCNRVGKLFTILFGIEWWVIALSSIGLFLTLTYFIIYEGQNPWTIFFFFVSPVLGAILDMAVWFLCYLLTGRLVAEVHGGQDDIKNFISIIEDKKWLADNPDFYDDD
jgi:hypothetical protein